MKGFCFECCKETAHRIDVVPITFKVRDIEVKCKEWRAICLECGNELYVPELHNKNRDLRNNAYLRALRGV